MCPTSPRPIPLCAFPYYSLYLAYQSHNFIPSSSYVLALVKPHCQIYKLWAIVALGYQILHGRGYVTTAIPSFRKHDEACIDNQKELDRQQIKVCQKFHPSN